MGNEKKNFFNQKISLRLKYWNFFVKILFNWVVTF